MISAYAVISDCKSNVIITSSVGGSLTLPETIQLKLTKNQASKGEEKVKEIRSLELEKLLLYLKNAQEQAAQQVQVRDIIESLSQHDYVTKPEELCRLINLSIFLEQTFLAHALAKKYLRLYATSKDVVINPKLPFLQDSKILLRKLYFLLTNDPGALFLLDEHGNPTVITLSLEEVVMHRALYIENSKVDISNLFLDSIDGISRWLRHPQAQQLDISNNMLRSLPQELESGKSLFSINASHNRLEKLPDILCSLPSLEKLDVSFNVLKTLPEQIGSLKKLVRINAKHNALKSLPESMQACTSLRWLDLEENPLEQMPENFREIVRGYNK